MSSLILTVNGAFINDVKQFWRFSNPPLPFFMLLCPKPYVLLSQQDQSPLFA